jgi:hypothetical protein
MFRVLAFALAFCLCGCTIVHQELDNRGGYVDYLADEYWWKADSKKMRTLRAYALHTAIARIAMISPKGATERNQLAYQIGNAGMYAKLLVTCAYDTAGEPCFYFDSIMVDYVAALYGAAVAALPLDDAKKLLNDITGGIVGPAAAVDALQALIKLGTDAVRYGTVSAALYRDSLELEVQVWINSPNEPGSQVSSNDVATLAAVYATGKDDMPAWKAEIERLVKAGLEPTPNRRYLSRLFTLMTYACKQITPDPVFRQKCIVDPGATASAQVANSGGSTQNSNTQKQANPAGQKNNVDTSNLSDQQKTDLQQKQATLVALQQQIANNNRMIDPIQNSLDAATKQNPPNQSAINDLQAQLTPLKQQNDQLLKQAKDLQSQIKAIRNKP